MFTIFFLAMFGMFGGFVLDGLIETPREKSFYFCIDDMQRHAPGLSNQRLLDHCHRYVDRVHGR